MVTITREDALHREEESSYCEDLEQFLKMVSDRFNVPGISVGILANGHRLFATAGFAESGVVAMTENSRFHIGAIAKGLLTIALLRLVDDGVVETSMRLGALFEELEHSQIGEAVTVEHLLTETGGFVSRTVPETVAHREYSWDVLARELRESKLLFEPGCVFSSSPLCLALVAEGILRLTGSPAMGHVKTCVSELLGCETERFRDGPSRFDAAWHLFDSRTGKATVVTQQQPDAFWRRVLPDMRLTPLELTRVAEAVMSFRRCTGPGYISGKSAKLLQERYIRLPKFIGESHGYGLPMAAGAGFYEYLPGWLGLDGPAFGQSFGFRFHREENFGIAVAASLNHPVACNVVFREILTSLGWRDEVVEQDGGEAPPDFSADELEGTYQGLSKGTLSMSRQGDELLCQVRFPGRNQFISLLMTKTVDRGWMANAGSARLPLGFLHDTRSGMPVVMVGMEAYKKVE